MENSMKTKRYQIMINAILILVTLMIVLPFVLERGGLRLSDLHSIPGGDRSFLL